MNWPVLLAPVTLIGASLAMGNRIVIAASQSSPLALTDFYQVLDTSDVPPGVVNILTGNHADLAGPLASHLNVDAVWSFSATPLSEQIERASAGNLKRTWVNNGQGHDWAQANAKAFLAESTEVKTVWIPWGE